MKATLTRLVLAAASLGIASAAQAACSTGGVFYNVLIRGVGTTTPPFSTNSNEVIVATDANPAILTLTTGIGACGHLNSGTGLDSDFPVGSTYKNAHTLLLDSTGVNAPQLVDYFNGKAGATPGQEFTTFTVLDGGHACTQGTQTFYKACVAP